MSQASGITLAATTRAHMLRAAVAAGTLLLSGCASLAAERAGPALATSSGPARSRCEATAWVEAAPALAEAEAAHQPGARSAPLLVRGEALFRPGAKEPLPLPSLLASLPRHDRAQQHLERYEDLEIPKQKVRVLYTVGAVLGLLGAGMAAGFGIHELSKPPEETDVTMVLVGAGIGCLGVLVPFAWAKAIGSETEPEEETRHLVREYLFLADEGESGVAASVAEELNRRSRDRCTDHR